MDKNEKQGNDIGKDKDKKQVKDIKEDNKKKKKNKRMYITIGVAVGVVIILVIVLLLLFTFCKKGSGEKEVVEEIEETAEKPEEEIEVIEKEEPKEEPCDEPEEEPEEEPDEDEDIPIDEEEWEAPTIELEILGDPTYMPDDDICYYRVKATVTGDPFPDITWSKDDSDSAWGDDIAQVNLYDSSETYTLIGTATNLEDSDTDSILITWGCNRPPVISEIVLMGDHYVGVEYTVSAVATDPDGDILSYSWSVTGGSIANSLVNPMVWTTPNTAGDYDITIVVDDGRGGTDSMTESVKVIEMNQPPIVSEIFIEEELGFPAYSYYCDYTYYVHVDAEDPDGDVLSYSWDVTGTTASGGTFSNTTINPTRWTAPGKEDYCTISVTVSDGYPENEVQRFKTVHVSYYIY